MRVAWRDVNVRKLRRMGISAHAACPSGVIASRIFKHKPGHVDQMASRAAGHLRLNVLPAASFHFNLPACPTFRRQPRRSLPPLQCGRTEPHARADRAPCSHRPHTWQLTFRSGF
jgi:hypothetical protein